MKKLIVLVFNLFFLFSSFLSVICSEKADLNVSADSAVLILADNSKVLFKKNEHKERAIASTTKIMTALLTLEYAELDNKLVTIDERMVPVEGSSMYLKLGDVVSLETLAKGMLSVSGNDAAHSAAIAIAGSLEKFANLMNERAFQIGMKNTHFVTPSGLDKGGHHSTAYDMAILGASAMENEMFFNIASKKNIEVEFIEPQGIRNLRNSNRLLREYEGCVGIKTGFTKLAGRCLVSCAERNNIRLVAVTLDAPNDWNDHKRMFDYGFSKIESIEVGEDDVYEVNVVGGKEKSVDVFPKKNIHISIPKGQKTRLEKKVEVPKFLYAPVKENSRIGRVVYTLEGEFIASIDLFAQKNIEAKVLKKSFLKRIIDFFRR